MTALITGGAASGKSEYAEWLLCSLCEGEKLYLATMLAQDGECRARVLRHRRQRAGKGFSTLECPVGLQSLIIPAGSSVLLECLGNLAANELYAPGGSGDGALEAVCTGLRRLSGTANNLVIVSNEVFGAGERDPETRRYQHLLGEINRYAASLCDFVAEVVCGIVLIHKGAGI